MAHRVHVRVNNHIAHVLRPYPYEILLKYWSHSIGNYKWIVQNKPWFLNCKVCRRPKSVHKKHKGHKYIPGWDGKAKFIKNDRLSVGLFWATYREIEEKEKIKFKIHKSIRVPDLAKEKYWVKSEGKYNFQNDCVDKIENAILRGRGGLVLNATGSGKTRIAAMTASRFKCDFLFVVDQLNLLYQAQKDISKHLGEKVGFVGESKFKIRRFTVATRQTLALHINDEKFRRWFEHVKVLFIDEIHEMLAHSNFDIGKATNPCSIIGLTATLGLTKKPIRMKAYSLAGPVIYEYKVTRGMSEGVLSKGIVIQLIYNNKIEF